MIEIKGSFRVGYGWSVCVRVNESESICGPRGTDKTQSSDKDKREKEGRG